MSTPPEVLSEELESEELVKIDVNVLERVRRLFSNVASTARRDPGVLEVLRVIADSIVKTRILKALEGRECKECFDSELLELTRIAGWLIRGSIDGSLPLTQDFKVPVKALVDLDFSGLKKHVNLPSKVLRGEVFYIDLYLYPLFKVLRLCEVVS